MTDAPPDVLRQIFKAAPFIASLGIEVESASRGHCQTRLMVASPVMVAASCVAQMNTCLNMTDHWYERCLQGATNAARFYFCTQFSDNLTAYFYAEMYVCGITSLRPHY